MIKTFIQTMDFQRVYARFYCGVLLSSCSECWTVFLLLFLFITTSFFRQDDLIQSLCQSERVFGGVKSLVKTAGA